MTHFFKNVIINYQMKEVIKMLKKLFYGINTLWLGWIAISFLEIIAKNLGENPQYSFWNLFNILINHF